MGNYMEDNKVIAKIQQAIDADVNLLELNACLTDALSDFICSYGTQRLLGEVVSSGLPDIETKRLEEILRCYQRNQNFFEDIKVLLEQAQAAIKDLQKTDISNLTDAFF